jgi:hypothetical protein
MSVFQIIALVLLSLVMCVHLVFCFLDNEIGRKITKPLCIPSLILLTLSIDIDGRDVAWQVYVALVFALLGDIFLIGREKSWALITRTGFFSICQIFYIWTIFEKVSHTITPWWAYLITILLAFIVFVLVFVFSYKSLKYLACGAALYFGLLAELLSAFVLLSVRSNPLLAVGGICGAVLHIISDIFLVYTIFINQNVKRRHLYIMGTYLGAQILIVLSLIF